MKYLLIVSILFLSGCVCYCRLGDQKITTPLIQQESKGEIPSGLGTIVDILLK